MATELQLAVDDVIDGIGSPVQWILRTTAGSTTAAPFVGEDHLIAAVIEGGRVPISKARIDDLVQTHGVDRIGNVQQDAIAGTGTGGQPDIGKSGDVVALVSLSGGLSVFTVVATVPQASQCAGIRIGENKRPVHNTCILGSVHGNLDHFDAEQRRIRIFEGRITGTIGQFFVITHATGTRDIDIYIAVCVGIGYDSVGMGAAAGLHRAHLYRVGEVADIKNADALHALLANRVRNPLETAIQSSTGFLYGHD